MVTSKDAIDVVYTWVDDQWPGYGEELSQYAQTSFDKDPSRTRDNLEILKFSLRSIETNFDNLGTIFLFTCRPQIPNWLRADHPRIKIVHHDEIMSPDILPTFNSLAIISHLHLLPSLSDRFLYVEDDMVFRRPIQLDDFVSVDGKVNIYPWKYTAPDWHKLTNLKGEKPWNLALAMSGKLVDERYGKSKRSQVCHLPLLINRPDWQRVMEIYAGAISQTRASRFRSVGNVDPASLYLWTLLAESKAILKSAKQSHLVSGYVPLEDFWPITFFALAKANIYSAKCLNLNDNFGKNPSKITEFLIRTRLQTWFPNTSTFERLD